MNLSNIKSHKKFYYKKNAFAFLNALNFGGYMFLYLIHKIYFLET